MTDGFVKHEKLCGLSEFMQAYRKGNLLNTFGRLHWSLTTLYFALFWYDLKYCRANQSSAQSEGT